MKYLLAIILIGVTASAQDVTYHPLYDKKPDVRNPIDVTDKQSDVRPWMLNTPTPALVDMDNRMAVTITGTIAQAQADLSRAVSNTYPATVRDRKNPRTKEEVGGWGTNIRSGNGLNEVKETLARMAEEIELLKEEIERLKAK